MKSLFSTKLIISTNHLLFTFILLPWLLPYFITQVVLPGFFVLTLQVVSVVSMAFYIVKNLRYLSNTKMPLTILCFFYLILIISTICNNGVIWTALTVSLSTILMCTVVVIVTLKEDHTTWQFVAVGKYICLFFLLINILIMVRYPGGIPSFTKGETHPYFLYGNMNTMVKFIFPGMCCSTLLDNNKKISLGTAVFWFGIIFQFIAIYRTATAFVALMFVTLWVSVERIFENRVRSLYLGSIITIGVLEVMIVLISNASIMELIAKLFNKSPDFSGRLILWQRTIMLIKDKPLWGYGLQQSDLLKTYIGNISGSHNYYLDLVFQCGLCGMGLFLLLILILMIRIRKKEISRSLYIVIGYVIATLLMLLTEPYLGHDIRYFPLLFAAIALSCRGKIQTKKTRMDIPVRRNRQSGDLETINLENRNQYQAYSYPPIFYDENSTHHSKVFYKILDGSEY